MSFSTLTANISLKRISILLFFILYRDLYNRYSHHYEPGSICNFELRSFCDLELTWTLLPLPRFFLGLAEANGRPCMGPIPPFSRSLRTVIRFSGPRGVPHLHSFSRCSFYGCARVFPRVPPLTQEHIPSPAYDLVLPFHLIGPYISTQPNFLTLASL